MRHLGAALLLLVFQATFAYAFLQSKSCGDVRRRNTDAHGSRLAFNMQPLLMLAEDNYIVSPYGPSNEGPLVDSGNAAMPFGLYGGEGLTSARRSTRERQGAGGKDFTITNKNVDPYNVLIESPTMGTRRITASILVDGDVDDVWSIITDYDNLAVHVPNLVKSFEVDPSLSSSRVAQNSPSSQNGKPYNNNNNNNNNAAETETARIFQEGAQTIIGFTFSASLLMDMRAEPVDESEALRCRRLQFKLVDSFMFGGFDGTWTVRAHSRVRVPSSNGNRFRHRSLLTYSVLVRPRGPVPVAALEWRIREDVPTNLIGVKAAVQLANNGGRIVELGGTQESYFPKSGSSVSSGSAGALGSRRAGERRPVPIMPPKPIPIPTPTSKRSANTKTTKSAIAKKVSRLRNNDNGWDVDETLGAYIK